MSQQQIAEHANELLWALSNLTNAPIFDQENLTQLDQVSEQALLQANTALLNSTQPYLPFYKDDIATTLQTPGTNSEVPEG